jgi:cell division protein FtsB
MPARTATAAPRRHTRSSTRARRRAQTRRQPLRLRWERIGRVALLIVLAVVAGLYIQRAITYLSVRSQTSQQQAIVSRLVRQNAKLMRQQSALNNPATIQQDARALGMVLPGERPYAVSGLPGN